MIKSAHKKIIFLTNLVTGLVISLLFFPIFNYAIAASVSVTATVPDSTASFAGFAPAGSVVFIKESGFIVGSTVTNSLGNFSKTVVGTPGNHIYSIFLTDNEGRSTPEVNLSTVTLSTHTDTPIININLPPTISITKNQASQGDIVSVFGQSAPGSSVNVYVNNVKRFVATVGADSKWRFDINGVILTDDNDFYAINTRSGAGDSAKSFVVNLKVLSCEGTSCNRTSPPTSNPVATPTAAGNNFNIKVDLGGMAGYILLLTSIFSSILLLLILIILFLIWISRRRKKKDILEELEAKVGKDIQTPNPLPQIRSDFDQAEKEI